MKKNYLFSLLAFAFAFCTANAQFVDDFESYPLGTYHGTHWSSWGGTAGSEDIIVSSNYAFDGTKSGLIGGSTTQDAMLTLGNKTTGQYYLTFQLYIPTGKSGYLNFQGLTSANGGAGAGGAGVFNSPNLIFNNVLSVGGSAGMGGAYPNVDDSAATYTWSYPQNTWFTVSFEFNADMATWEMTVDGTSLGAQPFDEDSVIGAIDFYSFDTNNEMYIDAIQYVDLLSIDENNLNTFSVYPNPVRDVLHISTTATVDVIEVYDVLGHKVLTHVPNSVRPEINMSALSSGTYFVKASQGNQFKTIKIIK
ncbi:MAG: T9SS type A sorting domain-containing protein [Aquaticitalea sp.]